MSSEQPLRLAAVVLAGGGGVRMGGVDKAAIEIGGITLLERALAVLSSADEVVVVGEQVPTSRPVTWIREDPSGGGPAAGLLAGIDALARKPDLVCVMACDMPWVTVSTVRRLREAAVGGADVDAAVLVDGGGRRQTLMGVYRYSPLIAGRPAREDEHGMPVRRLVEHLRFVEVPALGDEARDVDTWEDLRDLDR